MNKTILVFCAHSDDQIIGPGGTLAKYAQKNYSIKTFIFSQGVLANPWLKKEYIGSLRVKEAEKADKIIGGKGVEFFDLEEGKFNKEKEKTIKKIKKIILKETPEKIFTHSINDPHPDHRAVQKQVLQSYDELKVKSEVYSFRIWNLVNIKRNFPKFIVDITRTFKTKKKALSCFKSQKISLLGLLWNFYLLSFINGILNKGVMAEVFYRVR